MDYVKLECRGKTFHWHFEKLHRQSWPLIKMFFNTKNHEEEEEVVREQFAKTAVTGQTGRTVGGYNPTTL